MRYLIFFFLILSCNQSQIVEDCPPVEPQLIRIVGYFILEDDFLISNLDGIQPLSAANLTVGFDFDNSILIFETDELKFPIWRYHSIAMDGIDTHGRFTILEATETYSEIQLNDELNFWINENQDAPIFFHLNLEI